MTSIDAVGSVRRGDAPLIEAFPGVTRRNLAWGERLTLVEIRIEAGGIVPEHSHPHEQAGTVAAGRIRIRIGSQTEEIAAGDSYLIPGGLPHEVHALEPTTLIEVFSPPREDFADGEPDSQRNEEVAP